MTPSIKWPVRQRKGWPQRADKAELTLNMPGFHSALKRYIQSRLASGVDGAPGRRTEENPLVWVYNCITVRYPVWSRDELGGESSVSNIEHYNEADSARRTFIDRGENMSWCGKEDTEGLRPIPNSKAFTGTSRFDDRPTRWPSLCFFHHSTISGNPQTCVPVAV